MLNMIRADLFKMYKSSAMKVIFGITVLCAVVMTLMAYFIQKGTISHGMTGIGFMFSDVSMISILGAVISGIFICGDFDNKAIHQAIASGNSRRTVIVSKAITFFFAAAFILLPYAIATAIALCTGYKFNMGSVGLGFLFLLTKNSGFTLNISDIFKLLTVILALMAVYIAQLSICVPLSVTLKKPVFVVAIYYVFNIICGQLIQLGKSFSIVKSILLYTPFSGDYTRLTLISATGDIIKAIFVSLAFALVMLAVTYSAFKKSEVR